MDRQLSALELSGKLIRICAESRILRNQTAVGHVDNADSVRILQTFEHACKKLFTKSPRCTTDEAIAVDAISKSELCRLRRHLPLLDWIHNHSEPR